MTELEKLVRARMYIEKLANGINPLDDSRIPDSNLVNQVRLSRCFFYVSGVLQQVIENGGTALPTKEKKAQKSPFSLQYEKRSAFRISQTPIPISEITKRINELSDAENMRALSYKDIKDWLVAIGMLQETVFADGKRKTIPTENGMQIGITLEDRVCSQGAYQVTVYGDGAQQFVIDNLDAILAHSYSKSEMQGTPWLPAQEECLIDLYKKAVPMTEIAITLKRNPSSIRARLKKLGYLK